MAEHPITKHREDNSLTLDAFAKKVGVNKSTVLRWERGKPLSLAMARKIAKATGDKITVPELVDAFSVPGASAPPKCHEEQQPGVPHTIDHGETC